MSEIGQTATQFFTFGSASDPVRFRNGRALPSATLAYETYGNLNAAKDNAILVFHALSGSQHAAGYNPSLPVVGDLWQDECHVGWWNDFIGPGRGLDTDRFFVICCNYLGGCYGSTGPSSTDPQTGRPYGSQFPQPTLADLVDAQVRLVDHFGIDRLHAVVGGSLGGLMAMSFATRYPDRVKVVIPLASGTRPTLLQRLHNFEQIYAIETDPNFMGGDYYDGPPPVRGLALARMLAHKTYVSLATLEERARQEINQPEEVLSHYTFSHPVESYMLHHGNKFVKRFDANTYLRIAIAWLRFDMLRDANVQDFAQLFAPCRHQQYMVFSIDSDVCFYPEEQIELVRHLKQSGIHTRHITVHSEKGHDAFLLDADLFTPHLKHSLEQTW